MLGKSIVFGASEIQRSEIDEVVDSLASGWPGTGPKVARFGQNQLTLVASQHHGVEAVRYLKLSLWHYREHGQQKQDWQGARISIRRERYCE